MKKRAQAALEFLMTYGWAILIMLVVIAVLFFLGVFSSSSSVPSSCTLPAGFTCKEFSLDSSGRLYLDLGQATGKTITVTGVGCSPTGGSVTTLSIPVTVQTGSHGVVSDLDISCSGNYSGAFKGKLSIRYQPAGASYNKTITGDLSAPVAVVAAGEQDQWNSSYLYYRQVTVNTGVSSNLTNFPAYFLLDTQHLIAYGRMNSTCKDLRVINSTKNGVMDYEIENNTCNTTNTVIWFRVPQTNAATDYTAYVFYGNNSAADAQNKVGVWQNGYAAVWHMGDASDSAGANDCVNYGASFNPNGKFGGAYQFNRTVSNYFSCGSGSPLNLNNSATLTLWANITAIPTPSGSWYALAGRRDGGNAGYYIAIDSYGGTSNGFTFGKNSTGGAYVQASGESYNGIGVWKGLAGTYNGSILKIFSGGAQKNSQAFTDGFGSQANTFKIGRTDSFSYSDGTIDEVRVSSVVRSDDWLKAENGQTFSVGSEVVN